MTGPVAAVVGLAKAVGALLWAILNCFLAIKALGEAGGRAVPRFGQEIGELTIPPFTLPPFTLPPFTIPDTTPPPFTLPPFTLPPFTALPITPPPFRFPGRRRFLRSNYTDNLS